MQHNVGIDAEQCITALQVLGVPKGVTVALDAETTVAVQWYASFDHLVSTAGWKVMLYGSESTVMHNDRPSGGFWTADWNGTPHINSGANATQYINGEYDHSLINDSVPLWDTKPVVVEDDLPYTEAQLISIVETAIKGEGADIASIVSSAVRSQPVRDTIAYAGLWWLDKVVNNTVPAAATDAEKAICASVRAGLITLIKNADTA
jgi:hypothetical protein